jgi:hypothetical protein
MQVCEHHVQLLPGQEQMQVCEHVQVPGQQQMQVCEHVQVKDNIRKM